MANTGSQAKAIRDLLVQRLQLFNPTLDTRAGSPLYNQVIQPIYLALGTDLFDTDTETFLKDRLRQAFPNLSVTDGDAVVDILIRPVQLLLEAEKRETQIIRKGQSIRNAAQMRMEDAEALAANWVVPSRNGKRVTGAVRVYYTAPTYVSVLSTVTFSTPSGLRYFPMRPQFFSPDIVLLQKSGSLYYVDIQVIAEDVGLAYRVPSGTISRVAGLPGASRVTNLFDFEGGADGDTAEQLLNRVPQALTERSLNTRRGISARLATDFSSVRNIEVVGKGDPEMQRDVLTGGGQGHVTASGTCFIVGQFCLMFSQYEDRGFDGKKRVQVGDEIELDYWKFLYNVEPAQAHEIFTVENIIFDTRDTVTENIPSVVLLQMSGTPSVAPPIAATLPGVLPGVFAVVRSRGVLEISNIPGGILQPNTPRGTIEVFDNEVHLGGHYDVWVRPTSDSEGVVEPGISRSNSALLEVADLQTCGGSLRLRNQVLRPYTVTYSVLSGTMQLGEPVEGMTSGAVATLVGKSASLMGFAEFGETEFEAGEVLFGRYTGAKVTAVSIASTNWVDSGTRAGMLLSIIDGNDTGVFKILRVAGAFLYLDTELSETASAVAARVLSEVTAELFDPKDILLPFGDATTGDLSQVIGSKTVRTSTDLQKYGVQVGDRLEILDGTNKGVYQIEAFDSVFAGRAPILSTTMSATSSRNSFSVYRSGSALTRPMVRIKPGGVTLLDAAGQDSGAKLPYALPVGARALEAFSGAAHSYTGKNGFVLPDPGRSFSPTADLVGDPDEFADVTRCFSSGCEPYDGWIAVATLMDDGTYYLNSNLPASATLFLQELRTWFLNIVQTLGMGADAEAFVNALHPVVLGPPDTSTASILAQFEVVLPNEMFDGCNNVFMAFTEIDWTAEFQDGEFALPSGVSSFDDVLTRVDNGNVRGGELPPALIHAKPGDALTLRAGANAGSYLIHKVNKYKLCTIGSILTGGPSPTYDPDKAYDVVAVSIRGEFPVVPLSGLLEFFSSGVPSLSVPAVPTYNVETVNLTTGDVLDPWGVFQTTLSWVFKWINSMGFDLPDSLTLDPGETLKAIWELLFVEYSVGTPTNEQIVRMTFVEPTSVWAYNAQPCSTFIWNKPSATTAEVVSASLTLPLGALSGLTAEVTFSDLVGSTIFSTVLGVAAATAATLAELADALQAGLDPQGNYFEFLGVALATGKLTVRSVRAGADVELTLTASVGTDAFYVMGFNDAVLTANNHGVGSVVVGNETSDVYEPPNATMFSAIAGGGELLYAAVGDDVTQVFPGETSSGKTAVTSLPRDLIVAENYTSATANFVRFSDASLPSPLEAGVTRLQDSLWLYEQKLLMSLVVSPGTGVNVDRVVAVQTTFGSTTVTLPSATSPLFNFMASMTADAFDDVQVGDLLFIEEGADAGGYTIVERAPTYLVLDHALSESSGTVYRSNNDGIIDTGTAVLRSASAQFTDNDVGRYLTLWGTNRTGYDGSYKILSVVNSGSFTSATLDTPVFADGELDIHWVVVRAPSSTPDTSSIGGRTALVGVRPIRFYRGEAKELPVVEVSNHLDRALSSVTVIFDTTNPPKSRYKQPYQFVRTGVQHISSTAMKSQGRENGLYYFDVLAQGLGGDAVFNLPADTRLEPVFGSYSSDGYRLEVEDPNLVYSSEEKTRMVSTPTVLPVGYEDTVTNRMSVEGRKLRITAESAPLVSQIQTMLISELDRDLCASPLARHFLPSYVYFDVTVQGGNSSSKIAGDLVSSINALQPVDALDVSRLEKVLNNNAVTRYAHPIFVTTVTHDLDRRLVATRSQDQIDDDVIFYNGTNRISYYIPGTDQSGYSNEADIPDGERTYVLKKNATSTF